MPLFTSLACTRFSRVALAAVAALLCRPAFLGAQRPPVQGPVTVVETSLTDLRTALEQKRITSREIVQQYLARIATYEDKLNAVITVNPQALAIADSLDRERAAGRLRGSLHGIPIALKDNIQTVEMATSGGALAFADLMPNYDATVTRHLKAAGAIIIAKTQLTELANWTASGMPGNYTGLTGYGMNPWDPRRDPRRGGRIGGDGGRRRVPRGARGAAPGGDRGGPLRAGPPAGRRDQRPC